MTNDKAEGGIISKVIGRIFQGIRKIIDEDEEQDWAKVTALGNSSLHREGDEKIPLRATC